MMATRLEVDLVSWSGSGSRISTRVGPPVGHAACGVQGATHGERWAARGARGARRVARDEHSGQRAARAGRRAAGGGGDGGDGAV